jgi:hypothetical protein
LPPPRPPPLAPPPFVPGEAPPPPETAVGKAAKALEDMIDKALEKIPDTADEQQKPKEEEPETPTSNIKPLEIDAGQMAATAMGVFVLAHPFQSGVQE